SLSSLRLIREVTLNGSTTSSTVAEPFDGFTSEVLPDGNLELSLSLLIEGRLVACKTVLYRPLP
ncbi:MAG: hypothetical protein AB1758_36955, partial [Candidatus Eremiobacterota bacterium]